jgi:hypothetical protein
MGMFRFDEKKVNHQDTKAPRRFLERRESGGDQSAPQALILSSGAVASTEQENACGASRPLGALVPWWPIHRLIHHGAGNVATNPDAPWSPSPKRNHQGAKAPRRSLKYPASVGHKSAPQAFIMSSGAMPPAG